MTPTICPVAYGPHAAQYLRRWLWCYSQSATPWPVVCITDEQGIDWRAAGCIDDMVRVVQVSTKGVPAQHRQQIAGWLKAAAGAVCAPCIAVDCDLYPLAPLTPLADEVGDCVLGLCPDAGRRKCPAPWQCHEEHNSGLIYQRDQTFWHDYTDAWPRLAPRLGQIPYADEIVASICAAEMGDRFRVLDRTWNWSHWWFAGMPAAASATIHGHGRDGKAAALAAITARWGWQQPKGWSV